MTIIIKTLAAAAVSFAVAAPMFAAQVEAGPGITLTEAAQAKFNRDTGRDNQQFSPSAGVSSPEARTQLASSVGISAAQAKSMTLNEIFVAKINAEAPRDQQQLTRGGSVTMSSRSGVADRSQLVAAAGLSPAEASGLSLQQIAAAKFARDTGSNSR
jgi:hypothetical protein